MVIKITQENTKKSINIDDLWKMYDNLKKKIDNNNKKIRPEYFLIKQNNKNKHRFIYIPYKSKFLKGDYVKVELISERY